MFQGMSISPQVRQTQTLAPQMRQALDILQMTSLDLRAELQRQMEANPVIEDVTSRIEKPLSEEAEQKEHASGAVSERELDFSPDGERAEATLSCDDADRDYFLGRLENFEPTRESGSCDPEAQTRRQQLFDRQVKTETLQEHLLSQISLSPIPESERGLAELLIGYIDDDGYFRGPMPDIRMVSGAEEERILATLREVAAFDPPGCGARDLKECLLFQMEKLDDSPWEDEVRKFIELHLGDAAAHREAAVCESLGITAEEYPKVLAEVRKLDPRPGRAFSPKPDESVYVRPEVFVRRDRKGRLVAVVTDRDLPTLRISGAYRKMLKSPECPQEAKTYIAERMRAAETLMDAIANRQETIRRIAQEILDAQPEVFEEGNMARLRPLTMEQIAQKTDLHNATVSRTVRGKYMATDFGLVEMRRFFTSGIASADGTVISNVAIKDAIKGIVEGEDGAHPLSDDKIAKILEGRGIKCARRTVAKYREAMKIPGASARRQCGGL